MTDLVTQHWFRTSEDVLRSWDDPCVYPGCGRPQTEHVESVGEWMEPNHLFTPAVFGIVSCARCGRNWRHSTHTLISKKWRTLRGWRY